MKKGLIIDLCAAEILKEKGIDTGLVSRNERIFTGICEEYFEASGEKVMLTGTDKLYKTTLKPGCRILSSITAGEKVPVSYLTVDIIKENLEVIKWSVFMSKYSYELKKTV